MKAKFIFELTRTPDYIEVSRCAREEFLQTKRDIKHVINKMHELDVLPSKIGVKMYRSGFNYNIRNYESVFFKDKK
jgi:hypothetical protein